MNIKKIQLVNGGFKGAIVTYLREEEKNGRPFINEVTEKRKHPIHLGLETMFKDLRFYLLDITGMLRGDEDKNTKDYEILETEVVSLEFDAVRFCIGGEKKVFVDKEVKLKTPKVDDGDHYEHYDTVMKLVASIVEETKEYLAGTKKVDDVEVAVRYVQSGKAKGIDAEQLKGYTPEQLKEFAVKLLESNFGAVVMMNEDFEPEQEELEKAVEEGIVEIDAKADEIVIEVKEEKKWKNKIKEKAQEVDPVSSEEAIKVTQTERPAF